MPVRRGRDAERVPIFWGRISREINGRTVQQDAFSYVQRGLFEQLGLRQRSGASSVSTITRDRRNRRIIGNVRRTIGGKYVLISFGRRRTYRRRGRRISVEVFHRLPVPEYLPRTNVLAILRAGGRVVRFKYPRGEIVTISES